MSESLPKLEIEPEWCSAVMLSSISNTAEPSGQQTAEPIKSPEAEPVSDPLPTILSDSEATPTASPALAKPIRSETKSRPISKTPRPRKLPPTSRAQGLLAALRSRRMRIVATVVSLVFVGGLIVLNWKGSSSDSREEVADMDLSEFSNLSGFDQPRIGDFAEPQPLSVFFEAESLSAGEQFSHTTSGPHVLPLELVTHADHTGSRTPTAGAVVPTSATYNGSRGAVLTGQIEFDAPPLSVATPGRLSRSLGAR